MLANRKTPLCRYRYDPLDRLADCTPSTQASTLRFYLKERLTSEIQGSVQRSIFQQDDQLLAQQQRQDGVIETTLLATDQQRSVLHALDGSLATKAPWPEPYVTTLTNVNNNLASHGNNALTMHQFKALGSVIQQINNGKISNTTAHLQEAGLWVNRFTQEPTGTNFSGALLNLTAAGIRGVEDKNMRVTGLSLRRGSSSTPR
ncbi:hypothetical protein [Pseudomonas ogarae]|uniref:hypothetical protein n=1 Tax=Pseudomonas ogarae (strain DSM 112162 / CECT 30235 / F113) TaxID=1114970 RepID=UPI002E29AFF5|nr:hypothetical protein [Pseudomonas ogarae]